MVDLAGRRALVCGGTSGIGAAAAEALRDRGAAVTILARSASGAAASVSSLPVASKAIQTTGSAFSRRVNSLRPERLFGI